MAKNKPSTAGWEPIQHTHLTDRVYDEVRDSIISRHIKTDEQISVAQVAVELGVSRTPVLEAVKRLASEGLVEVRARRGSFVRGLTEVDVREIFQLRQALESFAVHNAIAAGKGKTLSAELKVQLDIMAGLVAGDNFTDYKRFTAADQAFHAAIIKAQKNARIDAIYANLNIHMHIARAHLFQSLEPPHRVHADHTAIYKAIKAGDVAAADAAITEHLRAIEERMIANVKTNGGSI